MSGSRGKVLNGVNHGDSVINGNSLFASFGNNSSASSIPAAEYDEDMFSMLTNQRLVKDYQAWAVADGLVAAKEDFASYPWFKTECHYRTLKYLHKKNVSFSQAMATLEGLSEAQAWGIQKGLSREIVLVCKDKIYMEYYLQYGFMPQDIEGLTMLQVEALHKLREGGLEVTKEDVRRILKRSHLIALFYLLKHGHRLEEAFKQFEFLEDYQAIAITKSFTRGDVQGLNEAQISLLINYNSWDLQGYQLLAHSWLTKEVHKKAFIALLTQDSHASPADVLNNLTLLKQDYQFEGVANGLSMADVQQVQNQWQAAALIQLKNTYCGLTAPFIANYSWFNSKEHLNALSFLLEADYDLNEAMAELKDTDAEQAAKIAKGEKRQNIVGLTEFQQNVVRSFKSKGMTGSFLLNNTWFHHEGQKIALEFWLRENMSLEDALLQVKNLKPGQYLRLVEVQACNVNDPSYWPTEDILTTSWLDSEVHCQVLTKLTDWLFPSWESKAIISYLDAQGSIGRIKDLLYKQPDDVIKAEKAAQEAAATAETLQGNISALDQLPSEERAKAAAEQAGRVAIDIRQVAEEAKKRDLRPKFRDLYTKLEAAEKTKKEVFPLQQPAKEPEAPAAPTANGLRI